MWQKVGVGLEQQMFAKKLVGGKGRHWNFLQQEFFKKYITGSPQSDKEWVRGSNCLVAEE